MSEEILHLLKGGFPEEGWATENAESAKEIWILNL